MVAGALDKMSKIHLYKIQYWLIYKNVCVILQLLTYSRKNIGIPVFGNYL